MCGRFNVIDNPGLQELLRDLGIDLKLPGGVNIAPTEDIPLVRRDDGKLDIGIDGSNAEIIQAAAPGAHVVKAFNTLGWRTMLDPAATGGPVSIPLVGDSSKAKAKVAEIVTSMGL